MIDLILNFTSSHMIYFFNYCFTSSILHFLTMNPLYLSEDDTFVDALNNCASISWMDFFSFSNHPDHPQGICQKSPSVEWILIEKLNGFLTDAKVKRESNCRSFLGWFPFSLCMIATKTQWIDWVGWYRVLWKKDVFWNIFVSSEF